MRKSTREDDLAIAVARHASRVAFGRPLVQNSLRALVVEAMVDLALPNEWRWCSGDWSGWDFEHDDGTRLEVKQSAARQTWTSLNTPASRRFDIAVRNGFWANGSVWVPMLGRHAHLYLFADHPVADETADHRDPAQWLFYLVAADDLPAAKTLSVTRLGQLATQCRYSELAECIERLRMDRGRDRV